MEILAFLFAAAVFGLVFWFLSWLETPRGRAFLWRAGSWFPAVLWIGAVAVAVGALVAFGSPTAWDPGRAGAIVGAALVMGAALAAAMGNMAWSQVDREAPESPAPAAPVPGRLAPLWMRLAALVLAATGIASIFWGGLDGDLGDVLKDAMFVMVFAGVAVGTWIDRIPVAEAGGDAAAVQPGRPTRPWARAAFAAMMVVGACAWIWSAVQGDWEPLVKHASFAGMAGLFVLSTRAARGSARRA